MTYLVLITGRGEGCDYTINCNLDWEFFEADSIEEVKNRIVEFFEAKNCPESFVERYQIFDILPVNCCYKVTSKELVKNILEEKEAENIKKQKQEELALLEKLEKKYRNA